MSRAYWSSDARLAYRRRPAGRMTVALFGVVLALPFPGTANAQITEYGGANGLVPKFADVGGISTRYYEYGEGEPLILLHGGGAGTFNSANVWTKNISELAEHFHVFAIDRLGSGMTEAPDDLSRLSYTGDVEFIHDFIQTMDLGRVNLVGHSAGGAVAYLFGLTHPEALRTLVIVSTGPEVPYLGVRKMDIMAEACQNLEGDTAWICRIRALAWLPDVAFDQDYWDSSTFMMSQPVRQDAERRMAAAPPGTRPNQRQGSGFWEATWERVQEDPLDMPVFFICGRQDPQDWHPPDDPSQIKRCMTFFGYLGAHADSNVTMTVYNQTGHFPYREHPEKFNGDVISFISHWSGR